MKRLNIATQMNIVFAAVTILATVIFLPMINVAFRYGYEQQHQNQMYQYHQSVLDLASKGIDTSGAYSPYSGHVLVLLPEEIYLSNTLADIGISSRNIDLIINTVIGSSEIETIYTKTDYGFAYMASRINYQGRVIIAITISDSVRYIKDISGNVPIYAGFIFMNIFLLGNIIIWVFSRNIVTKLQKLTKNVEHMTENNYREPIVVEGIDEIAQLAHSIDRMRREISINEATKQEMIQNIGHDLKTPIAVIKSYAEAIMDGVSEPKDGEIIIKQADQLNKRVKQLLEFNQALFLEVDEEIVDIPLKTTIIQAVEHYKFLSQVDLIMDLDDSVYPIMPNYLYIVLSNLLDNAIRYAKTQIVIVLENKKITIFNDGDHIEDEVLPKIFKPYEKGSKGQFGLGMGIVKRTLNRFDLNIQVENVKDGVLFTIEPM